MQNAGGRFLTVFVALILLVVLKLLMPTWTPAIYGYPNSISLLKQLEINGSGHEVMIRGNDRGNPVLIFLHGGPGCPEIPYVRKYQALLEKDFTVVRYDQRGAGKSYHFFEDYSNLSIDLLVEDLLALTDYVRKELKTDKVILVGHSFGSIVGLKAAYKAPEKYSGYVGLGQVGDFWRGELTALEYCLTRAVEQNNAWDVKGIEACRDEVVKRIKPLPRNYVWKYGGAERLINEKVDMATAFFLNPEYNLFAYLRYATGLYISDGALWKEIMQTNLPQEVPQLLIPCFFLAGKYDYLTPSRIANDYFERITAPAKEFIEFSESAHFPQFEEAEQFLRVLKTIPLKVSRSAL